MGLRTADGVHRRGWRISLCAGLSRAAPRTARTIRSGTLAPSAGIYDALRCRRWCRHPRRRDTCELVRPYRSERGHRRIRSGFRLRLDDLPGAVHARYGWRVIPARPERHVHLGTTVDESSYDGNGAHSDGVEVGNRRRGRSDDAGLLVRDVDGTAARLHCRLSDELVADG